MSVEQPRRERTRETEPPILSRYSFPKDQTTERSSSFIRIPRQPSALNKERISKATIPVVDTTNNNNGHEDAGAASNNHERGKKGKEIPGGGIPPIEPPGTGFASPEGDPEKRPFGVERFDSERPSEMRKIEITEKQREIVTEQLKRHADFVDQFTVDGYPVSSVILQTRLPEGKVRIEISKIIFSEEDQSELIAMRFEGNNEVTKGVTHTYFLDPEETVRRNNSQFDTIMMGLPKLGTEPTQQIEDIEYHRGETEQANIQQEEDWELNNLPVGKKEIKYIGDIIENAEIMPISFTELDTIHTHRGEGTPPPLADTQLAGNVFSQSIRRYFKRHGYDPTNPQETVAKGITTKPEADGETITTENIIGDNNDGFLHVVTGETHAQSESTPFVHIEYERPVSREQVKTILEDDIEKIGTSTSARIMIILAYTINQGEFISQRSTEIIGSEGQRVQLEPFSSVRADILEAWRVRNFIEAHTIT
jgi:hypothetical protein